ncbi:hypothetical protein C453_18805 [Haloferax elongans ATCC BAA-1513]|uniref:Uncharacterized protein n=1 Tax=Haloferax elongans ATCC BAA-1513 TaxID=1230453 RepID=M0H919_HALEO|nr:hypothetical protein [Haloferax elongans]ELZ81016.1 hypothetical protein C453_18805 [Haloferax elongans ATCC BAA-1513]
MASEHARTGESHARADAEPISSQRQQWRQAARQGLALWGLVVLGWLVVPADHPAQIAVGFGGMYAAILFAVALYFGYRGGETAACVRKVVGCRVGLRRSRCQCDS